MTFPACGLSPDGHLGPARSSCLALTSVQLEKRKKKVSRARGCGALDCPYQRHICYESRHVQAHGIRGAARERAKIASLLACCISVVNWLLSPF
ncbi:uncharacterized protein K441DRAFT_72927 [Cenococcum geophilum 1.58]|uniref:uncharacterized protein n=1 Tax=Cenococcum geophilum 1.58 TaxID=794803 RepID=UPI00358EC6A3|nr:hypothetical protein K441DRAFT_72927 [Cenococcum geophilum 1.58]